MLFEEELMFLDTASEIIASGDEKLDRTGVGTLAKFGFQLRYYLFNRRLPVMTTRKIKPLDPITEMIWFIAGDTDIAFLKKYKINIWDSWVREETKRFDKQGNLIGGSIGPGAYGAQWRNWEDTRIVEIKDLFRYTEHGYRFVTQLLDHQIENGAKLCVVTRNIDQLAAAIETIKKNPNSRRIIVSAWNPGRIEDQALPPCHSLFQFYVSDMTQDQKQGMVNYMLMSDVLPQDKLTALKSYFELQNNHYVFDDNKINEAIEDLQLPTQNLSLHLYARSQDFCVGTVYNTLQYAALAHMVAHVTNTWADEFIWTGSDVHVYSNQIDVLKQQLQRSPVDCDVRLDIESNREIKTIDDFVPEDFRVTGYEHLPFLKYPIAV